ncbi:MAG TPA: HAD-IIA family hydrolase [Acidimicrobiales bacterium]|nr:HAD-IIA family hydrolase [Acidimicrobiales bacterium]
MTLDAARACVVDLDGVVWLAGAALPGAVEGVAELRRRGIPVLFATNNAAPTIGELKAHLSAIGIAASDAEIATSAQAAAALLDDGQRVFVVGEAGLLEALSERGAVLADTRADAVVVGLSRSFDYDTCDRAAALVRDGARFVATNTDPTLPTPAGLRPGAGAIVAAVATASGRSPEVAGKPSPAMVQLVTARVAVGAVVGDRPSTDGAFAAALGVPFALVESAVAEPSDGVTVRAATLLDAVLALCS